LTITQVRSHLTVHNDCEFCDEFAGGAANSFAAYYAQELESRKIFEQDDFRVLPSLGQIMPGYLLVVPTRHFRAFADLTHEQLKAAEALKTSLTGKLRSIYGDCLLFEHGVRTSGSGGCGISHAHLHLVPFPDEKDPVEELIRAFPFEEVSNLVELGRVQPGRSYLYYESVHSKKYVFYPPFIPSQYVRRLLAEALGVGAWDWRQCGREERLLKTLSQVSELLAVTPRG
jgi:diadenosine tetraphosphate (Ap4A) HIT family hydrolase